MSGFMLNRQSLDKVLGRLLTQQSNRQEQCPRTPARISGEASAGHFGVTISHADFLGVR